MYLRFLGPFTCFPKTDDSVATCVIDGTPADVMIWMTYHPIPVSTLSLVLSFLAIMAVFKR